MNEQRSDYPGLPDNEEDMRWFRAGQESMLGSVTDFVRNNINNGEVVARQISVAVGVTPAWKLEARPIHIPVAPEQGIGMCHCDFGYPYATADCPHVDRGRCQRETCEHGDIDHRSKCRWCPCQAFVADLGEARPTAVEPEAPNRVALRMILREAEAEGSWQFVRATANAALAVEPDGLPFDVPGAVTLLREFVRLSHEEPTSTKEEAEFAADLDILTDKVDAFLARLASTPSEAKQCENCGFTGGHEDYCVHHPDVQARLRSAAVDQPQEEEAATPTVAEDADAS